MAFKVLIVDDIHAVFLNSLKRAEIEYDYIPQLSAKEAIEMLPSYQGLVIRSKFDVNAALIDQCPTLQVIARGGAGMDNIDENYALEKGISLLNAPEGNRQAVAEHMMGMLLSLFNRLREGDQEIRQGAWRREENRGLELSGRTVALIGYGHNGQAMARCLSGFGVQTIAYDKYKTGFSDQYAREVSMEEVVKLADIVSLHLPLTRETKGMIDDEYFFHFRKPIVLLNGARGGIVQIPALLNAMDQGKVTAAALDVLPVERFPDLQSQDWHDRLMSQPNLLLSPHVAGWTYESYFKIAQVLSEKLIDWKNSNR
jgi:D-3-phosphoglycerate dehydrogenase